MQDKKLPLTVWRLPYTLRYRLEEVENDTRQKNGWWFYLKQGWRSPEAGSHTIHEDTLALCIARLKTAVPCDCEECKAAFRADKIVAQVEQHLDAQDAPEPPAEVFAGSLDDVILPDCPLPATACSHRNDAFPFGCNRSDLDCLKRQHASTKGR